MEKKIIAIALVLVIMVTAFVGCSKKRDTTKINGKEYVLYTDKEGNTVINDKNQVVAVVTDENGEAVTFENGEDQTYFVQINSGLVVEDEVAGANYRLKVINGWEGNADGRIYKKGTDNKCYIQFNKLVTFEEGNNISTYLEALDSQNDQLKDAVPKAEGMEGATLTIDKSEKFISAAGAAGYVYVYKIVDKDGKLMHYTENYYFVSENTAYKIDYVCTDGVGYDKEFSFASYVDTCFKFIKHDSSTTTTTASSTNK